MNPPNKQDGLNETAPIRITGRHLKITSAIENFVHEHAKSLHFDYPHVMDLRVILEVENYRHRAEVVATCAHHIQIQGERHDTRSLCRDRTGVQENRPPDAQEEDANAERPPLGEKDPSTPQVARLDPAGSAGRRLRRRAEPPIRSTRTY